MNEYVNEYVIFLVTFPRHFGTISLCSQCGPTLMLIVMQVF